MLSERRKSSASSSIASNADFFSEDVNGCFSCRHSNNLFYHSHQTLMLKLKLRILH